MKRETQRASFVQVRFCDNCRMPHLVFFDDDGNAFADAIVGEDIGADLIENLQNALMVYSREHGAPLRSH